VTPGEYALAIDQVAPAQREPIAAITGAYLQARYSNGAFPEERAERAERAWSQIMSTRGGSAR
jgi:hypothetical protein